MILPLPKSGLGVISADYGQSASAECAPGQNVARSALSQSMNISLLHEAKRVTDTSASSRVPNARVNVMQTGPDPLHGTE